MTGKERYSPDEEGLSTEGGAQARPSHIAILRAARVRHKAIGRGLQRYFDAVVAEPIPNEFLNLLNPAEM